MPTIYLLKLGTLFYRQHILAHQYLRATIFHIVQLVNVCELLFFVNKVVTFPNYPTRCPPPSPGRVSCRFCFVSCNASKKIKAKPRIGISTNQFAKIRCQKMLNRVRIKLFFCVKKHYIEKCLLVGKCLF